MRKNRTSDEEAYRQGAPLFCHLTISLDANFVNEQGLLLIYLVFFT